MHATTPGAPVSAKQAREGARISRLLLEIERYLAAVDCFRRLDDNTDTSMISAAKSALAYSETLPNSEYVIPEASPNARGTGKPPARTGIRQFPGDNAEARTIATVEG